jgi:hypothetical protein
MAATSVGHKSHRFQILVNEAIAIDPSPIVTATRLTEPE